MKSIRILSGIRLVSFKMLSYCQKECKYKRAFLEKKNSFPFCFCANCYKIPKNVIAYKFETLFF